MAILISQEKLRELLDEAYMTGRGDGRIVRPHEQNEWRIVEVDRLVEKAIKESS